jgi:hypothetical protein
MRKYFFILMSALSLLSISQVNPLKHTMNWHFGNGCSINFNSGVAVPGTSNINTFEGCAAISDFITGNLLFYTDGEKVYDKLGNIMPNGTGLFGHNSSAQSSIIIPFNGTTNLYYIFTSDQSGYAGLNKGDYYSVVDLNLNGGFGDVTTKNVPLLTYATDEKLAAVRNCNGSDFWLITHRFQTDSFYVFPVTSAGVGTPVISKIGSIHQNISSQFYEGVGCLAVSPDGDKLAVSVYDFQNIVEIFHFNQSTGQITDPITLDKNNLNLNIFQPYGVTFSPNSNKLYFSHSNENFGGPSSSIFQVDLTAWTQPNIAASAYIVNSINDNYYLNISLAPDNKIYADKGFFQNQHFLDVISSPNNSGNACNFVLNGLQLPGFVRAGLPSFYKELISGDLSCDNITGIKSLSNIAALTIYPNPTLGFITIDLDPAKNYNIEVIDPMGNILMKKNYTHLERSDLDLITISEKIVFIKTTDEEGKVTISKCAILK